MRRPDPGFEWDERRHWHKQCLRLLVVSIPVTPRTSLHQHEVEIPNVGNDILVIADYKKPIRSSPMWEGGINTG